MGIYEVISIVPKQLYKIDRLEIEVGSKYWSFGKNISLLTHFLGGDLAKN
jgi:hypothetical protein